MCGNCHATAKKQKTENFKTIFLCDFFEDADRLHGMKIETFYTGSAAGQIFGLEIKRIFDFFEPTSNVC